MRTSKSSVLRAAALCAVTLASSLASSTSFAAATIVILNGNAAGVGFNDPTPAAPLVRSP